MSKIAPNTSEKVPKSNVGPKVWVESLMTREEWHAEWEKNRGKTANRPWPTPFFKSDYEWRWRMGGGFTSEEIVLMNKQLELIRKWVLKQKEDEESPKEKEREVSPL